MNPLLQKVGLVRVILQNETLILSLGPFFTKKLILLECWICSIEIKTRMSPKKLLPVRAVCVRKVATF